MYMHGKMKTCAKSKVDIDALDNISVLEAGKSKEPIYESCHGTPE